MPFYEIITEPGSHMVAEYADDTEAVSAIKAHHQKAISGQRGGPAGDHSAERIVKVLKYEVHPGDYAQDQVVPADQISPLMQNHTKDGLLNVHTFSAALRDQVSPLKNDDNASRHDSTYVMQEVDSLDPSLWQGGNQNA